MSVFIRLGFLAVFSFCFCASDARIGIRDYCTKNEKFSLWPGIDPSNELASKIPPQYSLFWGTVMFESGFLKSLRLKGNFKKNAETRDNGGTPVIDRRFDKGLDNLEELIIKLFPSNLAETDGQICATWNYMDNLGKFIKELCSKSK
ncbi:MAG: hypothetical protein LBQ08_02330, partial [Holosporaceae bacterium]|nr:hypothetical protein [Holosporaceae bacterium]